MGSTVGDRIQVVGNGYFGFPVMVAKYGGQVWPSMVAKYGGQVWWPSKMCSANCPTVIYVGHCSTTTLFIPLLSKTEIF